MNDGANREPADEQLKKPSVLSQLLPYLFTVAILIWVFNGLSSNVVDERHELSGTKWSGLEHMGVKPDTIQLRSVDAQVEYCRADDIENCPHGGDYELRPETNDVAAAIRRTPGSRIDDGAVVSVNYVKKVKASDIAAIVKDADLRFFLPLMILHALLFFLADTFSFGLAYKWFNAPDITLGEMMEVRGAPYVIQVGLAVLAEVFFPLYMWRVKKVPVTETISSHFWTIILDLAAGLSAITPAVIYNLYVDNLVPVIGVEWLWGCMVFWAFFFGILIFFNSPYRERARAWIASGKSDEKSGFREGVGGALQLLRTFSLARWDHSLRVYLVRLALLASTLISNYAGLRAMGVDPPLALAFISIPIIVISIFLPIGVGGYGGPQLIAWFLIVKLGEAGTADQVLAYSLLWSTGFLAGRAIIGMVFIRGFWKRCFPEGFKL